MKQLEENRIKRMLLRNTTFIKKVEAHYIKPLFTNRYKTRINLITRKNYEN